MLILEHFLYCGELEEVVSAVGVAGGDKADELGVGVHGWLLWGLAVKRRSRVSPARLNCTGPLPG